jgi:DNA gyrase/topoisomerase IV subunit B
MVTDFDSQWHAPQAEAELFIVEGDSAAAAVCAVRNPMLQAVLPLQGKPMNAIRASPGRLLSSPWLMSLTAVLGNAPGTALPLGELRYRALGTITPAILERVCVNPATRRSRVLSVADAEMAVKVFAGA